MDQSIRIIQTELKTPPNSVEDHKGHSQVFSHTGKSTSQIEKRGNLYAVIELYQTNNQQIDLAKITRDLFMVLAEEYYSNHYGNPTEALENASLKAHEYNQSTNNNQIQIEIGSIAIWGGNILHVNPLGCFLSVRRDHELIELDDPTIGSQLIRDGDLIILATKQYANQVLSPFFLENQRLSNTMAKQLLEKTEIGSPDQSVAILLEISLQSIPSEEEVIEIEITEGKKHVFKLPNPILTVTKVLSKLPLVNKVTQPKNIRSTKKNNEPNVYIQTPTQKQRKKNAVLVAVITTIILLVASIYFTYQKRQQQNTHREQLSVISTSKDQLEKAYQLARLNPNQAKELVEDTLSNLDMVLGVKTEYEQDRQDLLQQSNIIIDEVFLAEKSIVIPTNPPDSILQRALRVGPAGLQTDDGITLLSPSPKWQTPIRADGYFNNVYIVDPGAKNIWKYPDLLINPNNQTPSSYLTEEINIENAIDLTVDGSIYLLFQDRVDKLTLGKKVSFGLSGTHPPFTTHSLITTSPESSLIYITVDTGVLVFNKDGKYQKLLKLNQTNPIEEILADDTGNTVYIKISGSWNTINPEPK